MTLAGELAPIEANGAPMKVLVAEDNPVFQSVLRSMLAKWGYTPVMAREGNEAWRMFQAENAPRLAILDWMMPGMDGVEICQRVRWADREPYLYIILLTARTDSQDIIEGMESGADDYLTKPFNAHELRVRLRAGRRILDLQEQLVIAREALRVQATHDSLTGLLNRGSILNTLQTELARASRDRQPLSVLMADVDRFKQINDTLGHQAGDDVLRDIAARMKSAMRRYDSVGRYGGEEFLIVLPGCDADGALAQAERIRDAVGFEPFCAFGKSLMVTASLGSSSSREPQINDAETLIREADLALYSAKAQGRNRVQPFCQEAVGVGQ